MLRRNFLKVRNNHNGRVVNARLCGFLFRIQKAPSRSLNQTKFSSNRWAAHKSVLICVSFPALGLRGRVFGSHMGGVECRVHGGGGGGDRSDGGGGGGSSSTDRRLGVALPTIINLGNGS